MTYSKCFWTAWKAQIRVSVEPSRHPTDARCIKPAGQLSPQCHIHFTDRLNVTRNDDKSYELVNRRHGLSERISVWQENYPVYSARTGLVFFLLSFSLFPSSFPSSTPRNDAEAPGPPIVRGTAYARLGTWIQQQSHALLSRTGLGELLSCRVASTPV